MTSIFRTIAIFFAVGIGIKFLSGSPGMLIAGGFAGVSVASRTIDNVLLAGRDDAFLAKRSNQLAIAFGVAGLGIALLFLAPGREADAEWPWLIGYFVAGLAGGAAIETFVHRDPRPSYSEWARTQRSQVVED
jgi:hypothetical protein